MFGEFMLMIGIPRQTIKFLAMLAILVRFTMSVETLAAATDENTHGGAIHQLDAADHQKMHKDHSEPAASKSQALLLDAAIAAKYTPVRFTDIFVTPAGPKGLEYTTNFLALKGKPVRMTGFMVRHVNKDPAVFMLTDFPVSTMEQEYGVVDSIPPNVVHVLLPEQKDCGTTWQPYAVTVYGLVNLGRREETDGRVSYVRIRADHITVGDNRQLIDVMRPLEERDVNLGPHRHQH